MLSVRFSSQLRLRLPMWGSSLTVAWVHQPQWAAVLALAGWMTISRSCSARADKVLYPPESSLHYYSHQWTWLQQLAWQFVMHLAKWKVTNRCDTSMYLCFWYWLDSNLSCSFISLMLYLLFHLLIMKLNILIHKNLFHFCTPLSHYVLIISIALH